MTRRIVRRVAFVAGLCLLVASIAPVAAQRIVYVDDDAAANGDGRSWATAYRFLQDALADAEAVGEPIEIRVAQGIYKPTEMPRPPTWHDDTFLLTNGMILRGGYGGLGTEDPNAWNPQVNETILTGDLFGDDLPLPASLLLPGYENLHNLNLDDNSTSVVTFEWNNSDAMLEGVVVTAASPGHSTIIGYPGAGLRTGRTGRATIRHCVFRANFTSGIHCDGSTLIAEDCIFEKNVSLMPGGGVRVEYANAHLSQCVFRENVAPRGGGASFSDTDVHISQCTFERNRANEGGAAYYDSSHNDIRLEDCIFRDNATPWEPAGYVAGARFDGSLGGGLYARGSGELLRCRFQGNRAGAGAGACLEGVYTESAWTLEDCAFRKNRSYEGAGALLVQDTTLNVDHCMFLGNRSLRHGGAVYNLGSSIKFASCVFAGNASIDKGGAICTELTGAYGTRDWRSVSHYSHLALTNCTSVANLSPEGRTIWCAGARRSIDSLTSTLVLSNCILDNGDSDISCPRDSQVAISHTNLRGGSPAIYDPCESITWGPGNIDVDPVVVDPGYWDTNGTPEDPNDDFFVEGDYHLRSQAGRWDPTSESWVQDDVTSPCIDAGDPNSPIGDEPFPNGGIINIGAYGGTAEASKSYFGEPPCETIIAGDINGDCRVDIADVIILLDHWLESGS